MASSVHYLTIASLFVQGITGIFGLYGLTIPLSIKDSILHDVLTLEMIVQCIEFVFYIGFTSISHIVTLTQQRYYDWFLSTPIMLFTTSLYFFYENHKDTETLSLVDFVKTNYTSIIGIVFLNFLMLLVGFLTEIGIMNRMVAFITGTGLLCGSFGIIYEQYAKQSEKTRTLFWIMFSLWALYGVAFLTPSITKNIMYTLLDIVAKNFFGIFLYYKIQDASTNSVSVSD